MEATYVKDFFGTHDAVEAAVKTFDKILRRRYNVYGGRREASYKREDGDYEVIMSYTADWIEGSMSYMFPEYQIKKIEEACHRKMNKHPLDLDWGSWGIVKVPDIEAWRKNK